jgi:excisionase family DNA binding protein
MTKMLTTAEAATILGVTIDSAKKYCQIGTLHAEKEGRFWRIPQKEVERYSQERRTYERRQ